MSTSDKLLNVFDDYLSIQCNFSYIVCQEIFPEDADHYWHKWVTSDRNLLMFLSRLDKVNKTRVLGWGLISSTYDSED